MLNKYLLKLLSLPKTLMFNFYYFDLRTAIKLPILVDYSTRIGNLGSRNAVHLSKKDKGTVKIGMSEGSYKLSEGSITYWNVEPGAKIYFHGQAGLSKGAKIEVSHSGILEFGDGFFCNANVLISSRKRIAFGEDVLVGWNNTFIDGDGHTITDSNSRVINEPCEVIVGKHVWFGANCTTLKGSQIPDNCVVAYNSCITKKIAQEHTIIGGTPGRVLKESVDWHHEGFK